MDRRMSAALDRHISGNWGEDQLAPVLPIKQSLYSIVDHLVALQDSLDMTEPDSPERAECEREIEQYIARQIHKVDNIAEYQDHLQAQILKRKQQVQRLELANRTANRILERIDNSIQRTIEASGRPSIEGTLYSFVIRKSPPAVEVLDLKLVPQQYIRTTISESVDKVCAKVDLRAGVAIPGLELVTRKSVVRK